jgi:hypothetical protein
VPPDVSTGRVSGLYPTAPILIPGDVLTTAIFLLVNVLNLVSRKHRVAYYRDHRFVILLDTTRISCCCCTECSLYHQREGYIRVMYQYHLMLVPAQSGSSIHLTVLIQWMYYHKNLLLRDLCYLVTGTGGLITVTMHLVLQLDYRMTSVAVAVPSAASNIACRRITSRKFVVPPVLVPGGLSVPIHLTVLDAWIITTASLAVHVLTLYGATQGRLYRHHVLLLLECRKHRLLLLYRVQASNIAGSRITSE